MQSTNTLAAAWYWMVIAPCPIPSRHTAASPLRLDGERIRSTRATALRPTTRVGGCGSLLARQMAVAQTVDDSVQF